MVVNKSIHKLTWTVIVVNTAQYIKLAIDF